MGAKKTATRVHKGAVGARVMFCGHAGYYVADILEVAGAVAVRSAGPVDPGKLFRKNELGPPTHTVSDVAGGLWEPKKGIFCVPRSAVFLHDADGKLIIETGGQ